MQNDLVHIYQKYYKPLPDSSDSNKHRSKVIVFDLDETLGDFFDLIMLWQNNDSKKRKYNSIHYWINIQSF